jgi:hypothetical protein
VRQLVLADEEVHIRDIASQVRSMLAVRMTNSEVRLELNCPNIR